MMARYHRVSLHPEPVLYDPQTRVILGVQVQVPEL